MGGCICTKAKDYPYPVVVNAECPVVGHSGVVTRVEFSDEGALAISGSDDATVRAGGREGGREGGGEEGGSE